MVGVNFMGIWRGLAAGLALLSSLNHNSTSFLKFSLVMPLKFL